MTTAVAIHGGQHAIGAADPIGGLIPVGGIILWSGAQNAIPYGWQLCNGSAGTPDLRDKFVVGAGSTYAVGATGGAASATPSAHAGAAVAAHAAHRHPTKNGAGTQAGSSFNSWDATVPNNETADNSSTLDHSVTQPAAHSAIATLPPYYALCWIMRLR